MSEQPWTAERVEALKWRETLHMNFGGGGYGYNYAAVGLPELTVAVRGQVRRGETRVLMLDGQELPWGDWHAVAAAINVRSAAPDDANEPDAPEPEAICTPVGESVL